MVPYVSKKRLLDDINQYIENLITDDMKGQTGNASLLLKIPYYHKRIQSNKKGPSFLLINKPSRFIISL